MYKIQRVDPIGSPMIRGIALVIEDDNQCIIGIHEEEMRISITSNNHINFAYLLLALDTVIPIFKATLDKDDIYTDYEKKEQCNHLTKHIHAIKLFIRMSIIETHKSMSNTSILNSLDVIDSSRQLNMNLIEYLKEIGGSS